MYTIENLETTNFKPHEFFKSKKGKEINIDNLAEFNKLDNQQELLLNGIHLANSMEKLRKLLNEIYCNKIGKDITIAINSAYRCPIINKAVGGKIKSQHMLFQACDFYSPELKTIPLKDIIKAVREAKFEVDQMLVEETWIHFSTKIRDNRNMFGTYLFNASIKKREFKLI